MWFHRAASRIRSTVITGPQATGFHRGIHRFVVVRFERRMARDWALFLHLSGVLLFVGGSIAVTALRVLAIGKERPTECAVLLRAVRPLVPLVGTGLLLTLG